MNRRDFLQASGTVGLATVLAGCGDSTERQPTPDQQTDEQPRTTPTPGVIPERLTEEFETVVNIGDSRAIRQGDRSIVPLIEANAGDDTALFLPHGTYLVDEPVKVFEFDNFGIVGRGATIVPPDGYENVLFDIGRPGEASNFLIDNIEFDMREPNTGARVLSVLAGGEVFVRDLSVIGKRDAGTNGVVRIDATEPNAVAEVVRLSLPDGSTTETSASGCYVGEYHRGTVTFRDCFINGFADNGLYASPDNGAVNVEGGHYSNCDVGSIRVGGNSVIRGAYVRCDASPENFDNMRGIRVRQGSDVLIEDCSIDMFRVNSSGGAIVMAHWLESATIRNTRIRIDTNDVAALRIRDPGDGIDPEGAIRVDDLTITGRAANNNTIEVNQRHNCEFDHVYIRQTGDNRNGFLFDECRDAVVRNTFIDVTGEPIRAVSGSTVEQVDVEIPQPVEMMVLTE